MPRHPVELGIVDPSSGRPSTYFKPPFISCEGIRKGLKEGDSNHENRGATTQAFSRISNSRWPLKSNVVHPLVVDDASVPEMT